MLAGVPFAFSFDLDPGAVVQQVQRPTRGVEGWRYRGHNGANGLQPIDHQHHLQHLPRVGAARFGHHIRAAGAR